MTELTLPREVRDILVTDVSMQDGFMTTLREFCVEVQSKFNEAEYERWRRALEDSNHFILDGMRLALYGVALSGSAQPDDITLTLYTAGEDKPGAWVALTKKWMEQYGYRYRGWRPANKKPDVNTGDGTVNVVVVLYQSSLHRDEGHDLVGVFSDRDAAIAVVREKYGSLAGLDDVDLSDTDSYPWYLAVPEKADEGDGTLEFYLVQLNRLVGAG